MSRRFLIISLLLCALAPAVSCGQNSQEEEVDRLAKLLNWQPGCVVGEIGAGEGKMTLLVASKYVGATGKVYTTELDPKRLAHLEQIAAKDKRIVAVKAAEAETSLPPECCDSIFMRLVYHHLTEPADIDASLFRSLKPGGLLAVIDEEPISGTSVPKGVPKNRGGHGVPQKLVIEEVKAAGFQFVTARDDWPNRDARHQMYCVVFRKPAKRDR